MKRIKIRRLLIAGLVVINANMIFAAAGFVDSRGATAYHSFYDVKVGAAEELDAEIVPATSGELAKSFKYPGAAIEAYVVNKAGVYKYGSAVIIENYQLKLLQDQLKKAKKEHNQSMILQTRRKLAKARMDLFRDQLHFMVDREALRQDYLLTISDHKKELASDRIDLNKAKCGLKKEIAAGNENGIQQALHQVASKQKEVRADKLAIATEKASLKKEIKFADAMIK